MNSLSFSRRALIGTFALGLTLSAASAQQQVLVPWNHTWSWMHPMGAMPPRPAGGADVDFATTWYLKEDLFLTQYDGPVFGTDPKVPGQAGTIASFDTGRGPGPIGYGAFEYTTTPLPAGTPAEFTG